MFQKVLVPIALDHKKAYHHQIQAAKKLRDAGATITLLHVVEEIPGYVLAQIPAGITDSAHTSARQTLMEIAEESGPDVLTDVVVGHAGRTIVEYAESHEIDCIVMASHRPELVDYLLGTTAATVARHAGCSVVILR